MATNLLSFLPAFTRDPVRFLPDRLAALRPSYSAPRDVSLLLITWNVNEKPPPAPPTLVSLFPSPPPHLLVFSLQEIDMSFKGITAGDKFAKAVSWADALTAAVAAYNAHYVLINTQQLGGVGLFFFVHETVLVDVSEVVFCSVPVGVLGLANKGGVAVSFRVGEDLFLVIAAHLAAKKNKTTRRNQDVQAIFTHLTLPHALAEYYAVFFSGDLNYRINALDAQVHAAIQRRTHLNLLAHDQLTQEMAAGRVFLNFLEPPITFLPSYKVVPGTDRYDDTRGPAWCDRILVRSNNPISFLAYTCHSAVRFSDHFPVSSLVCVRPTFINAAQYSATKRHLLEQVAELSRLATPHLSLTGLSSSFKLPLFSTSQTSFTIANDGFVDVPLSLSITTETNSTPSWVTVTPASAVLVPGQSLSVVLSIRFDIDCIPQPLHTNGFVVNVLSQDKVLVSSEVDVYTEQAFFGLPYDVPHEQTASFVLPPELEAMTSALLKNPPTVFRAPSPERYAIYRALVPAVAAGQIEGDSADVLELLALYLRAIPGRLLPVGFYSALRVGLLEEVDVSAFIEEHRTELPGFNACVLRHLAEVFGLGGAWLRDAAFVLSPHCLADPAPVDVWLVAYFLHTLLPATRR